MPRTKVSKTNKRNREASHREEKIRDFDSILDGYLNTLELEGQCLINDVENEVRQLVERTKSVLLQMKFGDFLEMKLGKFSEWVELSSLLPQGSSSQSSMCNSTSSLLRSVKVTNPNDEGYLTEDSTNGAASLSSASAASALASYTNNISQHAMRAAQQQMQLAAARGRTPGPLSSARARRPRRSRSACGDFVPSSALKPIPSSSSSSHHHHQNQQNSDRSSRSKMRTPTAAPRHKAFSADRTPRVAAVSSDAFSSPPSAIVRWPKPGELVLSTCGSPLVAQVMPEKFANVNIPVRNGGVLSLRPKKLSELKADILEAIDPETLDQIKTLHANLDLIMNMANLK